MVKPLESNAPSSRSKPSLARRTSIIAVAALGLLVPTLVALPASAAITPTAGDRDGDGLPDIWETEGVDTDGDGQIDLDLPALGANPDRADLFVELDFMMAQTSTGLRSLLPSVAELDTIVETFAALPVTNPDGSTGVTIHLDAGPSRGPAYDLGGGSEIPYRQQLQGVSEVRSLRAQNSDPARARVFHYAVFGDSYGSSSSSGQAYINGLELLVTVGPRYWGEASSAIRVGTFIHELGHNLGLNHGGNDSVNYKPNYLSIMNYSYQLLGVPRSDGGRYYGYSTSTAATLSERNLVESQGLGASTEGFDVYWWTNGTRRQAAANAPIDWNADGAIATAPISLDINRSNSTEVLTGPNDLALLSLRVGLKGTLATPRSSVQPEIASNELTAERYVELFR